MKGLGMMEKQPIDSYTVIHLLYGFLAKKSGFSETEIVIVALLYEIVEPHIIESMQNGRNPLEWNHEGRKNILVDVLAAVVGSRLAK